MESYQRIRDLREDCEKTQKEIADILFMQREQYRRYETGEREPPFDVIIRLAKYYKVSIDYIAGLTNDKRGIGFASQKQVNQTYNANNQTVINNIKE